MLIYHKIILFSLWIFSEVIAIPAAFYSTMEPTNFTNNATREEYKTDFDQNRNKVTVNDTNDMRDKIPENIPRPRVKRQNSGAGKFAEASKMPQIKLLRLFLQMFKNFWDASYVGGAHPLHPNVPKVIVALYKEKVVEFFIPDVGEEAQKQMSN